jgi:hypothetical protein
MKKPTNQGGPFHLWLGENRAAKLDIEILPIGTNIWAAIIYIWKLFE